MSSEEFNGSDRRAVNENGRHDNSMIKSGLWQQIFTVSDTARRLVCVCGGRADSVAVVIMLKRRYSLILLMAHRRAAALTSCRHGDNHDKAKRK